MQNIAFRCCNTPEQLTHEINRYITKYISIKVGNNDEKVSDWVYCCHFSFSGQAAREFTDQLGRKVVIDDHVERVAVLQHQTLNLLVQLDATDKIVGVMGNWREQLGQNYERLAPELVEVPNVGDLKSVNLESLVQLKPQVVLSLIMRHRK